MFQVLTYMAALIACGVLWRLFRPMGIAADDGRRALTGLVYILLLPALVLEVLWKAPLGSDSIRLAAVAATGVLAAILFSWGAYKLGKTPKAIAGALILASAFPNATYMGLPVLEQVLGEEGRSIAIQFDLFACTPLLLSIGILMAAAYGEHREEVSPLKALIKVPPLWAAIVAVCLNLGGVPMPEWLDEWLTMLNVAVIPLMLISLGMSLTWSTWKHRYILLLLPAIAVQLFIMPLVVLWAGQMSGLDGNLLTGAILEAAMPSMVLGLVLCDRYGLNTNLYAITVTVTTALSLLTLPLWFGWTA